MILTPQPTNFILQQIGYNSLSIPGIYFLGSCKYIHNVSLPQVIPLFWLAVVYENPLACPVLRPISPWRFGPVLWAPPCGKQESNIAVSQHVSLVRSCESMWWTRWQSWHASNLTLFTVWHWEHFCLNTFAPFSALPAGILSSPILSWQTQQKRLIEKMIVCQFHASGGGEYRRSKVKGGDVSWF